MSISIVALNGSDGFIVSDTQVSVQDGSGGYKPLDGSAGFEKVWQLTPDLIVSACGFAPFVQAIRAKLHGAVSFDEAASRIQTTGESIMRGNELFRDANCGVILLGREPRRGVRCAMWHTMSNFEREDTRGDAASPSKVSIMSIGALEAQRYVFDELQKFSRGRNNLGLTDFAQALPRFICLAAHQTNSINNKLQIVHLGTCPHARLDSAIFKFPYDPGLAGKTISFKFQSINSFGIATQDLSTIDAIPFALTGSNVATPPAQTTDLINPDFEISSDLPPIGWITPALDNLGYDTSTQYAGARSLTVFGASVLAGLNGLFQGQVFAVRQGDSYKLSAALKKYSGTITAEARLRFYNALDAFISEAVCASTSTSWEVVSTTVIVPAGAVRARILLQPVTASGGQVGYDSISLVRVADLSTEVFSSITDSQTALTANYNSGSAKTLVAVPKAGGLYRISGSQSINRAATTSSTMPSLILSYKDAAGVTRTQTLVATSAGNATSVLTAFSFDFHADSSAAITLTSAGYASSGATSMRYTLGYTLTQMA